MSPEITEIIFFIGKGNILIANSTWCNYPQEAQNKVKIGSLNNINIEKIIELKADLIFAYKEQKKILQIIENRVEIIYLKHLNLEDMQNNILLIAKKLNGVKAGKCLLNKIEQSINQARTEAKKIIKKPKVLMILDRNQNILSNMYIAGRKGFLNEIIEICGGINAYRGEIPYPQISLESIINLSPAIILDLSLINKKTQIEQAKKLWDKYPFFKDKFIIFINKDYWVRKGPRLYKAIKELSTFIKNYSNKNRNK